jgi:hypothetical protein
MQFAAPTDASPGELGLGGQFLYSGELDGPGATLTAAANIAGAATLAASAEPEALRQAQREGVIDFLVNSLDEALRILKNEIRKRQPVAVGVSIAPGIVAKEMLDRGVLPDLLPQHDTSSPPEFAAFAAQGARHLAAAASKRDLRFYIWPIAISFTQRPAEFDALLLGHLPIDDRANRRWLQLSPRYLGSATRRLRSLECNEETASSLTSAFGQPYFSS